MFKEIKYRFERAVRKYRALLVLTNTGERWYISHLDDLISRVDELDIRKVKRKIEEFEESTEQLMAETGADASLEELEEIVSPGSDYNPARDLYVPKKDLDILFDNYERAWNKFDSLPVHAKIGVSLGGRTEGEQPEVYQLDASLFEDVVVLVNRSVELRKKEKEKIDPPKFLVKKGNAIRRSAVKAVYNFLEGYLNCLAYDILINRDDLTDKEQCKLNDEDHLSLRDKVLQYPRIALGREHPPIQENNCQPLRHILSREKGVRHALIHPRPHTTEISLEEEEYHEYGIDHIRHRMMRVSSKEEGPAPVRESAYWLTEFGELGRICDSSIDLVQRIYDEIDGKYGNVTWWLYEREENGCFPEKALK
jgi:hypothetical protein